MKSIILDKLIVKDNRVDYFFSVDGNLQKYFKKNNHMFVEYNYDLSNIPRSILVIPFISNVIPLIWITDSTIIVDELDQSFYKCLEKIRVAYQNMFPHVKFKGNIVVKKVVDNVYVPEHEAASLFSGGLDALTTFIRTKDKNPFLITEYGWHGDDVQHSDVWEADKENAIKFAKSYGLKNILIQSNYGTFIIAGNIDNDFRKKLGDTWWHGLHHSLAIISAAIPLAYKFKVKCIYIASSFSAKFHLPCASDPTVDNEIRYASGQVFHDGYELTRQDKVKIVSEYYSATKEPVTIRVCFKSEENCCNCEKCLRTILGIVAEGRNPHDFGFNIPNNLSQYVKSFLNDNVKFFTVSNINSWTLIQNRMKENRTEVKSNYILDWFLDYNFVEQRKKLLLKYRVTKVFPILKRKISSKLNRILEQNN
ncbi:peptidase [Priestia megaterium]|uniref:peptidase n=1 Tax=Priestia megaterium TaxID=1404 RepID=UPI002D7E26AF|nr:peptidase [Priestia megaterium]MEB4869796.1 peptidase [Priestia megaterium]